MAHIPIPDIPPPIAHGWTRRPGELIEPVWTEGAILPTLLEEIIARDVEEVLPEDMESEEDDTMDMDSDISDLEDSDSDW